MRVVLLSYPDVLPAALTAFRTAAQSMSDLDLLEVEPHLLRLVLPRSNGGDAQVLLAGQALDADVLVHRTVYPYRELVQPALHILAKQGVVVLNDVERSLESRSKARTLLALHEDGLPIVPTTVVAGSISHSETSALSIPHDVDLVLKPSLGAQGQDVRKARAADLCSGLEPRPFAPEVGPTLVQPLLASPYDIRAYVVAGECVAIGQRWSTGTEWRCNVSLGGRVTPLTDDDSRKKAEDLSVRAVDCLGLDHAAVDLLVDDDGSLLLSEVDAWGGFTGLGAGVGVDIASKILALAKARCLA